MGVTRGLSVDEAVGLLEGELGSWALADLVTEDVWLAFLRFGRRLFHVPDTPDADGLLFYPSSDRGWVPSEVTCSRR
ncbi:hypothetical protein GCM10010121_093250 [Streptomyces brasiliensis]|uniref:Uncharacterized protein n=1 Tax=Streptomyces brasiliensis TaxID=1954 RepID=A0A917P9S2_9ACTN|nr:hypothetical protein GCM10010121_093250 [Streptomyces brasiliensis]